RLRPLLRVQPQVSPEAAPPARTVDELRPTPAPRVALPAVKARTSKKEASLTELINVNGATQEELRRLPGIGPKLSERIVDERRQRPFTSVEELRRVPGIGPKILERLRPYVTTESGSTHLAKTD